MRITKFGHACVRLEAGGRTLVIDPGVWTSPEAVDGADAVLITHEHPDHYDPERLRRAADVPVHTIEAVLEQMQEGAPDLAERTSVVSPGGERHVAGFTVKAVGDLHAVIHPELPRFHNSGYVVEADDTRIYHPGDALTAPGEPVDVLCVPVSAPWLKASEAIDFAREVGAPRNLAIHDTVYSPEGLGIVDGHLRRFLEPAGHAYARLPEGADLG
jgi:L-ascorbate metabolism protein UlaG (beta-lactamase superfamily)